MIKKEIVVLGLEPASGNLGCVALAYSFFYLIGELSEMRKCRMEITAVCSNPFQEKEIYGLNVKCKRLSLKKLNFYKEFIWLCKKADLVVDFSEGDSFTDIYGIHRFFSRSLLKGIAEIFNSNFVMGPQTIGPFKRRIVKLAAKKILSHGCYIFARDRISERYAAGLGAKAILATDIAFMLPAENIKDLTDFEMNNHVGINVSALVWYGGYTCANDFNLKMSYTDYIHKLITYFLNLDYRVHLIAHVYSDIKAEDDYAICKELHDLYPETILAPKFLNPMQAKGYMAQCDCVIGARMHATIGAFSMGVPTISIAYSRKFQGLYESINYPYVIDAKTVGTEEAIDKTIEWIEKISEMQKKTNISLDIAKEKTGEFKEKFESVLFA